MARPDPPRSRPAQPRLLSRRAFLQAAALAAPGFSLARAQGFGPAPPEVHAPAGRFRGSREGASLVFRGVPFARPPMGPLRFRPAEPPAPFSGVRDALRFAAAPNQPNKPRLPQSEDCLYLNIWSPEAPGPHPVFVWIHGGGFTGGYSFDPVQDGASFAREGIVCVTVAYRLGVFGFLDAGPLLGAGYRGSASNGVTDLVEALRWVRRNIEAFGGDPSRVTVGGESAGAKLTCILMGVPAARGLFHSMISESGGAERVWTEAQAGEVAEGFGRIWAKDHPGAPLTTALPEDLIAAQKKLYESWPAHFPLRPQIAPPLVPRLPADLIRAGSTRGKRLLIGTNLDESALFLGPHPKSVEAGDLGNLALARFQPVLDQYAALYPRMEEDRRRIRAATAEEYWVPSTRVLEAHLHGGGRAWAYRLDYAPVDGKLHGYAFHSEDIRLVWGRPGGGREDRGTEAALGTQMHAAWAAFIQGQAPAAPGLPPWPEYRLPARATMLLDTTSSVASDPAGAELRLWRGML